MSPAIAQAHIDILTLLTPAVSISKIVSPAFAPSPASTRSRKFSNTHLPQSLSNLRLGEDDLDTPDELAIRALLLGIHYRTIEAFEEARGFLDEAAGYQARVSVSTWVSGVAEFERAVVDLKEAEVVTGERVVRGAAAKAKAGLYTTGTGLIIDADKANEGNANGAAVSPAPVSETERKRIWTEALKSASARLEVALGLATSSVDLSSRLDSRIAILKDEIAAKRDMMGIAY